MTFEEKGHFIDKFPSLKGKRAVCDVYKGGTDYEIGDRGMKRLWVTAEDVSKNCLDKKKVNQAIDKIRLWDISEVKCVECSASGCDDGAIHDRATCKFISEKLMKELGLE